MSAKTRKELFKEYHIDKSHAAWDNMTDNWMSVEIYREMHDGNLSPQDGSDLDTKYITDFLDKCNANKDGYFFKLSNPGSMYLTAKRMVYRYADQIINPTPKGEEVK